MKTKTLVFLFVFALFNLPAQEKQTPIYRLKPCIKELTADMLSQTEFTFKVGKKSGLFNKNDGIIVPPRFDSIGESHEYLTSDINMDFVNRKFIKVKNKKYYGVYLYERGDTVLIIPCAFDSVNIVYDSPEIIVYRKNLKGVFDPLDLKWKVKIQGINVEVKWKEKLFQGDEITDIKNRDVRTEVLTNNDTSLRTESELKPHAFNIVYRQKKSRVFGVAEKNSDKIIISVSYKAINYINDLSLFYCTVNDSIFELRDTTGKPLTPRLVPNLRTVIYDQTVVRNKQTNLYGVMANYNMIVPMEYNGFKATPHERYFLFLKNSKWEIYNTTNRTLKKTEWNDIYSNIEKRFQLVGKNHKTYLLDSLTGETTLLNDESFVAESDTLALTRNGTNWRIINLKTGTSRFLQYDKISFLPLPKWYNTYGNELKRVYFIAVKNGQSGLVDADNNILVPLRYDTVYSDFNIYNHYVMVVPFKNQKYCSIYNITKDMMEIDSIQSLSVFEDRKQINFLENGAVPANFTYYGWYVVRRNNKFWITRDLHTIYGSKFQEFDSVYISSKGSWVTYDKGKYGLWRPLKNPSYISDFDSVTKQPLFYFHYGTISLYKGGRISILSSETGNLQNIDPCDSLKNTSRLNVVIYYKAGKSGILQLDDYYLPAIFDDIVFAKNKLIWLRNNGLWGIINIR